MRKGFFKSLLSMLLVFIISTNVEMISYGQTRGLSAIKPDSCAAGTVQFVDQELLYDSLLNDETVKSVLRQGNRLFYTTSSGRGASLDFYETESVQTIVIAENSVTDVVTVDILNNLICVNNKIVYNPQSCAMITIRTDNKGVLSDSDWVYRGYTHPDIQMETQIRNTVVATLLTVMVAALGPHITATIVELIKNAYNAISSTSKIVYITRYVYTQTFVGVKYVDNFYKYSNYSGYIDSKTRIIYE